MKLTRRKFLIGAGVVGGGLVIAISLRRPPPVPGVREGTFQPNAYLQITPDNEVIFQMARAEKCREEIGFATVNALTDICAV